MGVISSQSNIVYGENEDSLKNKCEAVPQPSMDDMDDISNMKNDNNVKTACKYANEERDQSSMENVSGNLSVSKVEAYLCNEDSMENVMSMSGVQPEGSIRKKMNTSNEPSYQRLRGSIHPNLSSNSSSNLCSTQRLREYFTTLSSSGRNVGRGEKSTPIKRKLLDSKQVPNLVKVFDYRVHDLESGESVQTGSPAKRRRLVSRGQTTQQPAAKL